MQVPTKYLKSKNIFLIKLDSELLLSEVLKKTREEIINKS